MCVCMHAIVAIFCVMEKLRTFCTNYNNYFPPSTYNNQSFIMIMFTYLEEENSNSRIADV